MDKQQLPLLFATALVAAASGFAAGAVASAVRRKPLTGKRGLLGSLGELLATVFGGEECIKRSEAVEKKATPAALTSEPACVTEHPHWLPGMSQKPPFDTERVVSIDPTLVDSGSLYALVISAVVPRPIAFISSLSKGGVPNLSPYSYFNVLSHDPPVLAVGHCWSRGKPKDSLANILETKEFVVAIISEWCVEAANHTCGPYAPEVDEMKLAGLHPLPSIKVKPPRILECAINLECRLRETIDLEGKSGSTTNTVILADIVQFHVAESVASRSPNSQKLIVDPLRLKPMSRFGGNIYGKLPFLFEIPRPDTDGKYPGEEAYIQSERDKQIKL